MNPRPWARLVAVAAAAAIAVVGLAALPAQAYSPTPGTIYQLPSSQPCLKGRGNCAIYPKAAQLADGRLVASFEQATVPSSGTAKGETLPVYTSIDDGTSWQLLSQVQAPAYLSHDPAYAKYTSAWTNPYLYVLPTAVGGLAAGTLLMAAVVSGDDRTPIRTRLLDYFALTGADDPRVTAARRRLASLLY